MKEYKTSNLASCPYLQMSGLKYLRPELESDILDRPVVVFVFEDSRGIGLDLELDFAKSDFKKYRDVFFFFRGEIEKLKRNIQYINKKTSDLKDEKHIDELEEK